MFHAGLDDYLQALRFLYEGRWVQMGCCCSLSVTVVDAPGSCTQLLRWTPCLAWIQLDQVRSGRRLQQLLRLASPLKQQLDLSWASVGYLLDNEREHAAAFCQKPLASPAGSQPVLGLHADSLRSAAFSRYPVGHGYQTRWIGLPWSFFDLHLDQYLSW